MDDRLTATAFEAIMTQPLTPEGDAAIKDLLLQIEAVTPGTIEAMAARLQLRRMGLSRFH